MRSLQRVLPKTIFTRSSLETGILTEGSSSYMAQLAPNWRRDYDRQESSKRDNSSPQSVRIKNPLLEDNPQSGRNWLFPKDKTIGMETIHKAHQVESLLSQATDKYTDLINKEGYEFKCSETEPVEFIESRLYWISCATGVPFPRIVKEASRCYVEYGNLLLVKARVDKNHPTLHIKYEGKVRKCQTALTLHGKPNLTPIGGYYLADPMTMHPIYNKETGHLASWEQRIPGRSPKTFTLEEVIHLPHKPPPGKDMGVSIYEPVLDDIRALRDVEEYVIKLLYKHLFPLIHHEVPGLGEEGYATDDQVREAVINYSGIAPDGILITPPDHKISAVDTKNSAIDASPYLKHLLQRVLMGIGLSEAIMGLGDAAVGMSDMLTAQMHDRVKSWQQDIEWIFNLKIIAELLIEAGFDPISSKKDRVEMTFNEVELESLIRMENHAMQLYEQGGYTEDEVRQYLRKNPLTAKTKKGLYIYTNKIPVIEAQIKAEFESQKDLVTLQSNLQSGIAQKDHENSKDLASHQHQLSKDASAHQAALGIKTDTNKAALSATGKPAPNKPVHTMLKVPKLARKAANIGLNPTKSASGGSAGGSGKNKDNPSNQHGNRGAPRFSKSPAAGASSKKTPRSSQRRRESSDLDNPSELVLEPHP